MQTSTSSLSRSIDLGSKLSSTSAMRLGRVVLKARACGSGRQERARADDAGLCHEGGATAEAIEGLHIRAAKRDRAGNAPRRASIWRGAGADMADYGRGRGGVQVGGIALFSTGPAQSRGTVGRRGCTSRRWDLERWKGGIGMDVHMKMTSIFYPRRAQTRGCESASARASKVR